MFKNFGSKVFRIGPDLNFGQAGFKAGVKRLLGSMVRTVIAALCTWGVGQIANIHVADLVSDPTYQVLVGAVFTILRGVISHIAEWTTTVPVVLPADAVVVAVQDVPSDQVVS